MGVMKVERTGDEVQITCTPSELAKVLQDLWGHSMGMCEPGRDLTRLAREIGVIPGMVQ